MKVVAIVVAVIVLLVGCCGGITLFGSSAVLSIFGDVSAGIMGDAVLPQVEHKAAIVQYIGTVDDITLSFEGTGSAQEDDRGQLAFDISGDKGSGLLLVQQSASGFVPAEWAILEIDGKSYVVFGTPPVELVTPSGLGRPLPGKDCEVSSKLPMRLSYNMRGGLSIDDENFVTYGIGQFDTNMRNVGVSKGLRVTDFFEPEGTRIVQLKVARGAVIDSEKYRRDNRANEAIVLVDAAGLTFRPIGYVLRGPQNTDIVFEPTEPIMSIEEMPKLPSAGTTTMLLIFRIPIGAELREVRVGDEAVATLNVTVPESSD